MDLDLNYAFSALATNFGYALIVFLGVIWIISLLINDRDARVWTIKGSAVFLIVSALILTFSMGRLQFPAVDNFVNNVWQSGLSLTTAQASQYSPNVNVQIDVPPPTVITQNIEAAPSALEPADTVEPVEAMDESTAEVISESEAEESSIFDLGSVVSDGLFEDGVPYFIHEVQSGDTIYNIRHRFGLSEAELLDRNDLDIRRPIIIGQDLKITIVE